MLNSNYIIIDRKAHRFEKIRFAAKTALFTDIKERPVDHGTLSLNECVYALMKCEEAKNISLVLDKKTEHHVVTLLFVSLEKYEIALGQIETITNMKASKQNLKINRYAESICEKLANGVRLKVTDSIERSNMLECSSCGMLNPSGTRFCYECGEEMEIK